MKLSRNSWHFWLYNRIYNNVLPNPYVKQTVFCKSLCAYFWSIVFAILISLIFFIPSLPVIFFSKHTAKRKGLCNSDVSLVGTAISCIIVYCLFVLYSLFAIWMKPTTFELISGIIGYVCIVIYLSAIAKTFIEDQIEVLKTKKRIQKIANFFKNGKKSEIAPKPKKTSLLISYLKAKKQKACPIIEWTD